jgi:broad specificity phosphatase PhoE
MERSEDMSSGAARRSAGALGARLALAGVDAVRHGESTANAAFAAGEPVAGADADVGLSELGVRQAGALGRWFAGMRGGGPDLVVCSTYRRAGDTWAGMARAASALGAVLPPVIADERLRDREAGVFELLPPAAVRARAPEEAGRRARVGDWSYRPPGGESLSDVALRVRDFLYELDRALPGGRVLLVAHDAVVAAEGVGAVPPAGLPPVPNASVSRWTGDGTRLRLAQWAGTAHLAA